MKYIDGFILVVPKKKVTAYKKMSKMAGKIWRKYGALEYYEAVGDDLKVKMGKPFPRLAKAKSNEAVFFSWIVFKSKKHRNQVNKKVMRDPRIEKMCQGIMPFDMKRMSYGGFKIVVDE